MFQQTTLVTTINKTHYKKHARADSDDDWTPPRKKQHWRAVESKSVATQTKKQLDLATITHSDCLNLQLKLHLTDRQMTGMMQWHRQKQKNRFMYQPNYIPFVRRLHNLFEDCFKTLQLKPAGGSSHPAVLCSNVAGLLQQLESLYNRKINIVRLSADMGKQFLKVAICPIFYPADAADCKSFDDVPADDDRSRTIIIVSVRDQPETLAAMRKIFTLLKFPIQDYELVFIADFKLLNIVFGLSTNAATFPCVFCERSLSNGVDISVQVTAGKLRTVANIKQHAAQFLKNNDEHKFHRSCVGKPLSLFPLKQTVDSYVAQPPLHSMLGVVNWCHDNMAKHVASIPTWSAHFYITRSEYHGNNFEGNACRRLLQQDSLDFVANLINTAPPSDNKLEATLFLNVLQRFTLLRAATYRSKLQPGWQITIADFTSAILQLNVKSIPTKIHSICAHLKDWCLLTNTGCKEYTDEWIERSHQEYNNLWAGSYQVRNVARKLFQEKHLSCVLRFNSHNVPFNAAVRAVDDIEA